MRIKILAALLLCLGWMPTHAKITFTAHHISNQAIGNGIPEPTCVKMVDLDGDGDKDFLVISNSGYYSCSLYWLENQGSLGYKKHGITTALSSVGLEAADFNNDKHMDFVINAQAVLSSWYSLALFVNDGQQGFDEKTLLKTSGDSREYQKFQIADMDGDGDLDIVSSRSYDNRLFLLRNDGVGNFSADSLGTFPNPVIVDWDKDGKNDILIPLAYTGATFIELYRGAVVHINNGTGHFTMQKLGAFGPFDYPSVLIADFDADSVRELCFYYGGIFYISKKNGATYSNLVRKDTLYGGDLTVADINHDGKPDIFSSRVSEYAYDISKQFIWARNCDRDSFAKQIDSISGAARGSYYISPTDFDGDGDLDMIQAIETSAGTFGEINWLESDVAPRVISPNGGATLVAGSVCTVQWKSSYDGKFSIAFSTDSGQHWIVDTVGIENTGSCTIRLPATVTANAFIKIYDSETGTLSDVNDTAIALVAGNVQAISSRKTIPALQDLIRYDSQNQRLIIPGVKYVNCLVEIFNLQGTAVYSTGIAANNNKTFILSTKGRLSSGYYYCRVRTPDLHSGFSFVVLK